jgi:hypothetical protein
MNQYYIRFNTKHGDTDLVWRVFENDKEYLVKGLSISVPVYDKSTIESGIVKWNIACNGFLSIENDIAYINAVPSKTI